MAEILSSAQSAALFDILTHHDTFAEIQDFRAPGSLKHYGPPFTSEHQSPSTFPALQGLVSKFILSLPGLRDVPEAFWKHQVHDIIEDLERANLSESYDKGAIGSRKTLATAVSALIEYPVRGTAGGVRKVQDFNPHYNLSNGEDLSRAFRDFMDAVIYGTALQDVVKKMEETDKITDHEPLVQATHEFILVNLASFMHYTLILSPKGQYLLKLLGQANTLVPYMLIRQTLKIGNVASMINAMTRVVLAKMSVTSVTNWIGLTQGHNMGMNLMQQIISTVLHWDCKDFEKRAAKIENDREGLSKAQINCLKDYSNLSRDEQNDIRQLSQQNSISIVISILANSSLPTDLSPSTHAVSLEYLSTILSIRDRKEIIRVLCHSSPDHLTTAVRSAVSAYDPVIRNIHNAVNLSDTVYDFECFINDLLKLSKIQTAKNEPLVPTVGDFVQLLKKHQYACHKFIHQCCKNGKELTSLYFEWAENAASQFRRDAQSIDPKAADAGDLTLPLNELFFKLPKDQQSKIISILDQHTQYLANMHDSSIRRFDDVLKSTPSTDPAIARIISPGSGSSSRTASPHPKDSSIRSPFKPSSNSSINTGPGAYLSRWQDLLDNTLITPQTPTGEVTTAGEEATNGVGKEKDTNVSVGKKSRLEELRGLDRETTNSKIGKPNVEIVIAALGKEFRALLGTRDVYW